MTAQSETVDMTGEVEIAVGSLEVNRKLDGLVALLHEAQVWIPVLVFGQDD